MSPKAQQYKEDYYQYELVGVVVHSGTADQGHYYSMIKERTSKKDKWYKFDDKKVELFNIDHLGEETFGGDRDWHNMTVWNSAGEGVDIYRDKNAFMLFYKQVTNRGAWKKKRE